MMLSSEATTQGVKVETVSEYLPDRSNPEQGLYFFAYHVKISNVGDESVQLISRHWMITDATGHVEEVSGPGVIGEQPVMNPGECHEYTSFCPLKTTSGSMEGTYQMVTKGGKSFDAKIAPFKLFFSKEMLH